MVNCYCWRSHNGRSISLRHSEVTLRSFFRLFRRKRHKAQDLRDNFGNVIVGDVNGIVVQIGSLQTSLEPVTLPWRHVAAGSSSLDIFNLLTWRSRLSGSLLGRDDALADLLAWARNDNRSIAIRILSGQGGSGKSRLAAEVAETLRNDGWSTGLITLDKVTTLPMSRKGLFIAVDYPETNRSAVKALLIAIGRLESSLGKIRLLLVSRQPLSFWEEDLIASHASELCDTQEIVLAALSMESTTALIQIVSSQLNFLFNSSPVSLPEAAIAGWYFRDPDLHGLPLIATAAAIHSVLEPASTISLGGAEIIAALVGRERMRFREAASNAEWIEPEAAPRLFALSALRDGLDETALTYLALTCPEIGLPPPDRIVDKIEALGWWHDSKLRPPQPDLVAAELLYQVLASRPQVAPSWLAAVLKESEVIEIDRLSRLMHDLGILRPKAPQLLSGWLVEALARVPNGAKAWAAILHSNTGSYRLAPLAVEIGKMLLQDFTLSDVERVRTLNSLARRLNDTGNTPEAVKVSKEAVKFCQRLTKSNPNIFQFHLAVSFDTLSSCLSEAGDRSNALDASQKAVNIFDRLVKVTSGRLERDFALCLANLSNRLSQIGDRKAALDAIKQSIEIRRRLAASNTDLKPDLAASLAILSNRLSEFGDRENALVSIQQSVDMYQTLAQTNPARFEVEYALILSNFSNRLGECDQKIRALIPSRKAVEILSRLVQTNRVSLEPHLAACLNNLANRLMENGFFELALPLITQAVEIRGRLALVNKDRFEPDFATSLSNLSNCLSELGCHPAALDAILKSITIRRSLVVLQPNRFSFDLAQSLNNYSNRLLQIGKIAMALCAIREAIKILESLAVTNPSFFNTHLELCRANLSILQAEAGDDKS